MPIFCVCVPCVLVLYKVKSGYSIFCGRIRQLFHEWGRIFKNIFFICEAKVKIKKILSHDWNNCRMQPPNIIFSVYYISSAFVFHVLVAISAWRFLLLWQNIFLIYCHSVKGSHLYSMDNYIIRCWKCNKGYIYVFYYEKNIKRQVHMDST